MTEPTSGEKIPGNEDYFNGLTRLQFLALVDKIKADPELYAGYQIISQRLQEERVAKGGDPKEGVQRTEVVGELIRTLGTGTASFERVLKMIEEVAGTVN